MLWQNGTRTTEKADIGVVVAKANFVRDAVVPPPSNAALPMRVDQIMLVWPDRGDAANDRSEPFLTDAA